MNISKPNILFFKSESNGCPNGYAYISISEKKYKIQPGDHLEYDVYIDLASPVIKSGVDIHFISGSPLRDRKVVDQNYNSSRPYTFLYDAAGRWFNRKMCLENILGETIDSVEIAIVAQIKGIYIACFKDIKITRDRKTIHCIYSEGIPDVINPKIVLGFSNHLVKEILWKDFNRIKLENINPFQLSPEIQLAERVLTFNSQKQNEWTFLIDTAKKTLAIEEYKKNNEDDFNKSLDEVRNILTPILKNIKEFTTYLIGHAHIDMNWLWTWTETIAIALRDFDTMTELMNDYPEFKFSQSQAVLYKTIKKERPDLFKKIQTFVTKGQWEITASMWVEADENMASGEAVVRQILLAKRFIKKHFNIDVDVCWQPDQFGHVWTMPQILKKSGINYYYFTRCSKTNPSVFRWVAPDGSSVIAGSTSNYNDTVEKHAEVIVLDLYEKQKIKDYMHVYGVGDHGGGPTRNDIKRGIQFQNNQYLPTTTFSTVKNYFDTISNKYTDLPEIKNELQFIFEGCYTTHADIKLRNRICENLFPVLETFSIFAMTYEFPYPKKILDDAWERTCFNQFHDILPGSAIHATYEETIPITDGIIKGGRSTLKRVLSTIANHIDTSNLEGKPIVVFNPSNWERTDLVKIKTMIRKDENVEIYDGDTFIPSQLINRKSTCSELLFIAENVPSIGYKTFSIKRVLSDNRIKSEVSIDDDLNIGNRYLDLKIDRNTGGIEVLQDKESGYNYIESNQQGNIFQILHEEGREMSAWEIGNILDTYSLNNPERIEIIEKGPVRILVEITYTYLTSVFIQRIVVYNKINRIDFPCTVDWREVGSRQKGSKFLKVLFPFDFDKNTSAKFEIPFGFIERENNGHEYPSQKWMSLSDKKYGVTFCNDSKYGCDITKNKMRLSLLRSSYEPDSLPDKELHHFTYSVSPHNGILKPSESIRKGAELNNSLAPIETDVHEGVLPLTQSFVKCSPENIIISAFKKSEEDDSIIMRFYETEGKSTKAEFNFSFNIINVIETDLIETPTEATNIEIVRNSIGIQVLPHEIKTIKVFRDEIIWPKHHDFIPVDH
ncbi:alpha-mannosidase [Bacteroidota bacterium]